MSPVVCGGSLSGKGASQEEVDGDVVLCFPKEEAWIFEAPFNVGNDEVGLGGGVAACEMDEHGDGYFVRRAEKRNGAGDLNVRVAGGVESTRIGFWIEGDGSILVDEEDILLHLFVASAAAGVAAAGEDDDRAGHLGRGALELDRSGLDVECAVDDLVRGLEGHFDLAGVGVDGKCLMLGQYGRCE